MRKRPVAIWIAASILSLYIIGLFALAVFQALRLFGFAEVGNNPIVAATRLAVGSVFGLLGLFAVVGLIIGKRWSRWLYLLPVMVMPILAVSDFYSGLNGGFMMAGPGEFLGFLAVMVFLYTPLFTGFALITLGTKVNAFFAGASAEVPSGIAEPPPPPTFEIQ